MNYWRRRRSLGESAKSMYRDTCSCCLVWGKTQENDHDQARVHLALWLWAAMHALNDPEVRVQMLQRSSNPTKINVRLLLVNFIGSLYALRSYNGYHYDIATTVLILTNHTQRQKYHTGLDRASTSFCLCLMLCYFRCKQRDFLRP